MPFHFKEAAANMLTNSALDPAAKMPELKVCAAALEQLRKEVQNNGKSRRHILRASGRSALFRRKVSVAAPLPRR